MISYFHKKKKKSWAENQANWT